MIEETMRKNLLTLARTYAKANGITLRQVSRRLYGNIEFFDDFGRRRASMTLSKFDEMVEKFRAGWPEDVPWPFLEAAIIPRLQREKSPQK
jgi:hypothetical protein